MNKKIFKEILTMEDFINAKHDKQFEPQSMQAEIDLIPTNLPESIKQIRIQEIKEKWQKEDV